MIRFIGRIVGLALVASCIAWQGHPSNQPEDRSNAKEITEARRAARKAVNQFLEVQVRLNRAEEALPFYMLGEPIILEVELHNTSDNHVFLTPSMEPFNLPYGFLVRATQYGKPVPRTRLGRQFLEGFKKETEFPPPSRDPQEFMWGKRMDPNRYLTMEDTWILKPHETEKTKFLANILADMTKSGKHELQVYFKVRVLHLQGQGEDRHVTNKLAPLIRVVRPSKPLKLKILNDQYQIRPRPRISGHKGPGGI